MNRQAKAGQFLLYLGWLAVSGCSTSPPEQAAAQDTQATPPAPAPDAPTQAATASAPSGCALPAYDPAALNSRLSASQRLPDKLVAKMVRQYPQLPELFRRYESELNLYALDTVRCQKFLLVPYLYQEYDYYTYIYYLTFSPDGRKLLDWVKPVTIGADEGWHAMASMQRSKDGRLRVTSLVQDASDPSNFITDYQDSIVTTYALTPQGRFVHTRLDSVRRALPLPPDSTQAETAG